MEADVKAVVRKQYGSAQGLEVVENEPPDITPDGVLVRVHAAALNRIDWYHLTGTPLLGRFEMGLRRPKSATFHADFSGTVEAVGQDVTEFSVGDEVFGRGAPLAQHVCAEGDAIARKPAGVTFEEAATVSVAGRAALQALRDHGQVRPEQKVLVNGASGGVGTFAVQIAKALGAEVTAVCSTANLDQARALGADHVIDYTKDDFTRNGRRYDVLFDNAGSKPWAACTRVLAPNAIVILVGGPNKNRLLGPLGHIIKMKVRAMLSSRQAVFFIAKSSTADLKALAELLEAGIVKPVIDRRYALSEVADAFRYLGEGHPRGKVVIDMT
jgi:NADPH:quinone reductase-like Zn-dependent oxidoreductase